MPSKLYPIDTTLRSDRVLKLRESFSERIVGQAEATEALTRVLEIFLGGFADPNRPVGSILFLGPTGTGKTSAVEALCYGLFGNRNAMIKIDCGEFQHSHEIAKLIGSPPGYLGHRETPPRLTQKAVDAFKTEDMRLSVVLFDEIEKASDTVWHILLGILDKGKLTLGDNSVTDFTQSIIVMTSNVGAGDMSKVGEALGFQALEEGVPDHESIKRTALSAARRKFLPEFINRLDEIVTFKTLTINEIKAIMTIELSYLQARLFMKQTSIIIPTEAAEREIMKQGYDKRYNARNIRRVIEKEVMLPIARAISTLQLKEGQDVVIDARNGKFFLSAMQREQQWP